MRVTTRAYVPGTHRTKYYVEWYAWALPVLVALGTSWFPTETSGLDVASWTVQRVLIVRVLCVKLEIVVRGPLFQDDEDEA